MYLKDNRVFKHHLETYGPQSKFGYKDFIPMFKAEKFNAEQWAELFRKAGAKYVVPVAEHHDGFPMYASDLTEWCAAKMGRVGRGRAQTRIAFWRVFAPRRALVVLQRRHHLRFRRQ
jgi:alpha-L-fucosidase